MRPHPGVTARATESQLSWGVGPLGRALARTRRSRAASVRVAASVALIVALAAAAFGVPAAGAQEGTPPEEEASTRSTDEAAPNTVTAYGDAADHGPPRPPDLAEPFEAMAPTRSGAGYWSTAADGGVFTFGDATFEGSAGAIDLAEPIVDIAAHTGAGYWLAASDGGVFTFGSARFHGSAGAIELNQPIGAMAAHPDGDGYWLVASDGGVFSFGSAAFHGSTGGTRLAQPIVGMAAHHSGEGYWLVAADGGIFTFGSARFHGSAGDSDDAGPVVGMAASPDRNGYWLATAEGGVLGFGVLEHGSAGEAGSELTRARTVGIAAHPEGDGYWLLHGDVPVLETRDEGSDVRALQQRLSNLGYWLGPIDGVFGDLTEQAVYAFQKYEGLPVDGSAGPATRNALARASRPAPRSTAGDVIEIDKARQLLLFVDDGAVAWAFNTSTGTEEPYTYEGRQYLADTPPGRWTIYREVDGVRESNLGRLIRPKYFHTDGIAIHGYGFVPPYPASHGCVRVSLPAIDYIWDNGLAPIGADVWVYGETPR